MVSSLVITVPPFISDAVAGIVSTERTWQGAFIFAVSL